MRPDPVISPSDVSTTAMPGPAVDVGHPRVPAGLSEHNILAAALTLLSLRCRRGRRGRHARPRNRGRARLVGLTAAVISVAFLVPGGAAAPAAKASPPVLADVSWVLAAPQARASHATARAAVTFALRAAQKEATEKAATAARHHREVQRKKAATPVAVSHRHPGASTVARPAVTTVAKPPATPPGAPGRMAQVVNFVKAQVGKPYVLGATGPGAFDCSGLVQSAYLRIGIRLPRVSQTQSTAGTQVSLNALRPGDILYWGVAGSAYHVAIFTGPNTFVGAENPSRGVALLPLTFSEPSGAVRIF